MTAVINVKDNGTIVIESESTVVANGQSIPPSAGPVDPSPEGPDDYGTNHSVPFVVGDKMDTSDMQERSWESFGRPPISEESGFNSVVWEFAPSSGNNSDTVINLPGGTQGNNLGIHLIGSGAVAAQAVIAVLEDDDTVKDIAYYPTNDHHRMKIPVGRDCKIVLSANTAEATVRVTQN